MVLETLDLCVGTYMLERGAGADLAAWGQARELSKYHNVTFAVSDHKNPGAGAIPVDGVEVLHYHVKPWTLRSVAADIRRHRFDAMSSHTVPFDIIACLSGTPHLLHDYGLPSLGLTLRYDDPRYYLQVNMARLFSSHHGATRMILPSCAYIARELERKTGHVKPVHIMHTGIEYPSSVDDSPIDYKYILFVGRHVPYKQVDRLVMLFERIRREHPDVHLVTAGGSSGNEYSRHLKDLAERVGNVHLLGYVEDVWPLYKGALVYATCSLYEGEDRPALEAQGMGLPVVSYDNYSHREVVKNGYCALGDDDFVRALKHYLSVGKKSLCAAQFIRSEYSLASVAAHYNRLLGGVI